MAGNFSVLTFLAVVAIGIFGVRSGWRGLRGLTPGIRKRDALVLVVGGASFLAAAGLAVLR